MELESYKKKNLSVVLELENLVQKNFSELAIEQEYQDSIMTFLNLVKLKDIPTYTHSLRVGLKSRELADYMHLDPKAMFYAGLLHDVGKCAVDSDSLKKVEGFNEKDMKKMMEHPKAGYYMLKGIHDFSAEIILRHHWFQENGYPKRLPKSSIDYSKNTQEKIDHYAMMLSLVDFYDSMSTRKNDKFGEVRLPEPAEVKQVLLIKHPSYTHSCWYCNDF